jgi:hypothetical protein
MIRKNIKEHREPRARMSQRELNDDIEIGDVITTDEGLRIKCVGRTSNGEPIFDKCRF